MVKRLEEARGLGFVLKGCVRNVGTVEQQV